MTASEKRVGTTAPTPDRLARVFLGVLDGDRLFWEVRTFDDDKNRADPKLKRVFKMSRADFREGSAKFAQLTELNQKGAGVFVTINRTDGKGKKAENVTDVVAVFGDTDGAPLKPMLALRPHIVVQSSPGNWHAYWRVTDCALDQFKPMQQAIAAKFDTDQQVSDLPRVMRLPGFYHRKGEPFLTTLHLNHMDPYRAPYTLAEIVEGLGLTVGERRIKPAQALPQATRDALSSLVPLELGDLPSNIAPRDPPQDTPDEIVKVRDMLAKIKPDCDRKTWRQVVWSVLAYGWTCSEHLAREWSEQGKKWDEGVFDQIVADFDPTKGTGYRTLHHYATTPGDWSADAPPPSPGALSETGGNLNGQIIAPRADRGDVANADFFARLNVGRICHVRETNEWLRFDPVAGWLKPEGGEADRAAKAVLAEMTRHAAANWRGNPENAEALQLVKHVKKSHDLPRIRAMIELAKSEPGMSVSLASFDADPMLLGVANGVLDLKTGALMPMKPDVLVSKRANAAFDPDAGFPRWEEFLRRVQPDEEMRAFLARLCGYFLTGSVRDHIFPVLNGGGGNGKGVFLETVAHLLGDYSAKLETETLMEHKRSPQAASPDLMKLRGARLAYCSETTEGQRLNSARVKEMTGGDTITARPLYGSPVTFAPSHKLLLMGNYKPEVSDMSDGMWRRMILVPFDVSIEEGQKDVNLPEKLKAEASGILNWALAGLRNYMRDGLKVPEQVSRATHAYKGENDLLGMWVREECELGTAHSERKKELYGSYAAWCQDNGTTPITQPRFTRRIKRSHDLTEASDERTILGIRVKRSWGNL